MLLLLVCLAHVGHARRIQASSSRWMASSTFYSSRLAVGRQLLSKAEASRHSNPHPRPITGTHQHHHQQSIRNRKGDPQMSSPHFSFGLISDIQYCDCDNAPSFSGGDMRRYRGALLQTQEAVKAWNACEVDFVAQLGDLIDGQNAGQYGAGLGFTQPQSDRALNRVIESLSACEAPLYHAVGNHELYNFDWAGLARRLQRPGSIIVRDDSQQQSITPEDFFYSWRVDGRENLPRDGKTPGWTFIMLNAYYDSIEQDPELPGYSCALALLAKYNRKCYETVQAGKKPSDYFAGITDPAAMRYVPFNGGVGRRQLEWLTSELHSAVSRGDRIIIMSHLPLLREAASARTLMYDADDVLRIMHKHGHGHVVAYFAGHAHGGGYSLDSAGIHHITLQSPLLFPCCFATVDVHTDRLELVGAAGGGIPSRTLRFVDSTPLQVQIQNRKTIAALRGKTQTLMCSCRTSSFGCNNLRWSWGARGWTREPN